MFARLAPILFLLSCGAAHAYSGNELLKDLKSVDKDKPNVLTVYDEGVAFGFIQGSSGVLHNVGVICLPPEVTNGQNRSIVQKYLENNPEVLHRPAHFLVASALIAAFPCKK